MAEDRWLVDVTNDDIRAARDALRTAWEDGAEPSRVALLRADLQQLFRTQAAQMTSAQPLRPTV
ncbi:MAG TPA: hypothetical protein VGK35_08495 [Actinotalea sp.]